jgi:hypothetical protein
LGIRLASTVAALATLWSNHTHAQQPGLLTPPPVTAVGPQDVILTGLRPGRLGFAARNNHAGRQSEAAPTPQAAPPAPVPASTIPVTAPAPAVQGDQFFANLDQAIEVSSRRYLTANVHSPWQIFHGLLALKQDFQLNLGNGRVNAIEWIATSDPMFDNQPLLMKTPHGGKFHAFTRPYAFEGHPAQFLALLSQSDLPVGYTFKVGNDRITLSNIIDNTMKEVNTREEVTWVLWGLQHYLKPDAQWVNQHNEPWSIERLVQIESAAPVNGAPCGGNHRLFALTRTRDKHLKQGGKLVGVWAQADYKIRQHIEIARSMQNSDGSFSSKFYETTGYTNDLNQRFNTSGHTMEFLSIGLPDERLNEPWVRSAVTSLCNDLIVNRQRAIDCGPLYHTLNALIIYRDRALKLAPATPVVQRPGTQPATVPSTLNPPSTISSPTIGKVDAKPVTAEKTLAEPAPASRNVVQTPVSKQPSAEALNELKLDGEFRERLNALTGPRPQPAIVAPDASARPLETTGQPVLLEVEAPASALTPENG